MYLDGDTSSEVYFDTSIRPVAEHMRSVSAPIHFLISKWDLLQERYTLAEVRGRLFDSPHAPWLRELIEDRVEHHGLRRRRVGTVRLIPVSSMGDFAYLDDDDGLIKKNPDKHPKPLNVEIPLVAVIPDLVMLA